MNLDPTRAYRYDVALAIPEDVYVATRTGEPTAAAATRWRFTLDDATREQVRQHVAAAIDDLDRASLATEPTVAPNHVRVRVTPGHFRPAAPADVLAALRDVPRAYNRAQATRNPDGLGFVDGLDFGAAAIDAVRPMDARDADTFVARECGGEATPDADEPVLTWENDLDREPGGDVDRQFQYVGIIPVEPSQWTPTVLNREQNISVTFRWDDHSREQIVTFLEKHRSGIDTRLEVWPSHLRFDVTTQTLHDAPLAILSRFYQTISRMNNHRGLRDVPDRPNAQVPRRGVELARQVYVGSRRHAADSRVDDWVAGLPDLDDISRDLAGDLAVVETSRDGATDDPAPDEADDDGGAVTTSTLRRILGR